MAGGGRLVLLALVASVACASLITCIARLPVTGLLQERLYIVPQANVLTGVGQRPVAQPSPKAPGAKPADHGPSARRARKQSLYIVPQADVLTGVGQRPVKPAGPTAAPRTTKMQQQAHAAHRGRRAPAAAGVRKPLAGGHKWSKAQRAVQESVMRAMALQRKQLEADARSKALKQYWSRIRSSISDQKRRRHRFAGMEAFHDAQESDTLDSIHDQVSQEREREQRRMEATKQNMGQEKAEENEAASADMGHIESDLTPDCGSDCQQSESIAEGSDGSQTDYGWAY
jgi:hypothetical protein